MDQQLVQGAVTRYHELLEARHLESTRAVLDSYEKRIDCHLLRPHFIDAETDAQVRRVAELLAKSLDVATDRLTLDAALRRKIGIPDYIDALLALDTEHGKPSLMGRFDGIVDRNGVFRVFEYNSVPSFDNGACAGEAFSKTAIAGEFGNLHAFRCDSLFDLAADTLFAYRDGNGGKESPVVGVPIASDDPTPEARPEWLGRFAARGGVVVDAPYEDFRREGERVVVNGVAIDLLLPRQSHLLARVGQPLPVFDGIRSGAVRSVFGLSRGFLASYKNTFELLTNPEYASLFGPDVAAELVRHIPWTRVLRVGPTIYRGTKIDLLPFLVQQREHMVLKPSGGRLGTDIVLGAKCTESEWKQALKRALARHYVVQERVLATTEPYAKRGGSGLVTENATATVEPFVWNGRAAGAIARVSTTGLHNLADGCSVVPVWVLG